VSGPDVRVDERTPRGLAGVVLAAGSGTRLRPLTLLRPKPLCPVGGVPLLDRALACVEAHTGQGPAKLAVNAHYLAAQITEHLEGRAHVSVEDPYALGTAGALGALRSWVDGRHVLLVNGDSYLAGAADTQPGPTGGLLDGLLDGWDGSASRLLVQPTRSRTADFADVAGGWRYLGACLLTAEAVARLRPEPTGLYEVLWAAEHAEGRLQLSHFTGTAIDCGAPREYLAANLHTSGGEPVVGAGADVQGRLTRSVVWDGAWVGPDEHLVDSVRAGSRDEPVTVHAS